MIIKFISRDEDDEAAEFIYNLIMLKASILNLPIWSGQRWKCNQ